MDRTMVPTITSELATAPLAGQIDQAAFDGLTVVYGRVELDIAADGTIAGLIVAGLLFIDEGDIAAGALESLDQLRAFDAFTTEDLDHMALLLGLDRAELVAMALEPQDVITA